MPEPPAGITQLLNLPSPDRAERLWELVYPELRQRAKALLRRERSDHTLSPTAVVHETYLRLATRGAREWQDRSHFYATASAIMRHVLIDHARARAAGKRRGGADAAGDDEAMFPARLDDEAEWSAAGGALDRLAETHERAAMVVALRVFGGLTVEEVARELGVSERTVKTDWSVACTRLRRLLGEEL
jgi:RNA polymerase sigma factor (TIGR02999 family)